MLLNPMSHRMILIHSFFLIINPKSYNITIFTHLKLCLTTVTHNLSGWKLRIFVWFETKHLQMSMYKHSFHSDFSQA